MAKITGKTKTPQGKAGNSKTKKNTQGEVLPLERGVSRTYLCAHICAANKAPKIGKIGQKLYQRAMSAAIWLEEEANELVWAYKAEVGYRMTDNPPSPIMSANEPNRPSRFPLGHANREGLFKKEELETHARGRMRIPDIVLLKATTSELVEMRVTGKADWGKLIPVQENIQKVIEIKFGNDKLSDRQIIDYSRIADGIKNFRYMHDEKHCQCDKKDNNRRPPEQKSYNPLQNPSLPAVRQRRILQPAFHPVGAHKVRIPMGHIFNTRKPTAKPLPLDAFLDQAPLTTIAVGVGVTVVVVVGVFVLAEGAAVGTIAAGVGSVAGKAAGGIMVYQYATQ